MDIDDIDDLPDAGDGITLEELLLVEQGLLVPENDDDDAPLMTDKELAAFRERVKAKRREPVPYKHKVTQKTIAVVDTETDPFEYGLKVKPFAVGFYDGDLYVDFWGDDCVNQFFAWLAEQQTEYIIYAHNGGKFDFFFFLKHLDRDHAPFIINGRLVKIWFQGQEFRDSFSIIPVALGAFKKDTIDYSNFKRDKRERNRRAILKYQEGDCRYSHEIISEFHTLFGDKLTMASAALPTLHSYHGFEPFSEDQDNRFRHYYYGGRNQCFETGVLQGDWKIYDRNSMYPAEMKEALHPISSDCRLQHKIDDDTDFACIDAYNDGALPMRGEDGGLNFTAKRGTFWATIHEIRAGLDTGTLRIIKVKHAWAFSAKANFAEFVDSLYNMRQESIALLGRNDPEKGNYNPREILYKLLLNSSYGKFALNPRKFKQYTMTLNEIPTPLASGDFPEGWSLHSECGDIMIWERPTPRRSGFYNVATAASITGAARANLLRNIALAERPIYCDTDSIICEGFRGDLDPTRLGGWKLEAQGTVAAIGGKKLYAVFNNLDLVKKASKGVRLEAADILAVCNGGEVLYKNPVPNFRLDGTANFVARRIQKTG